MKYSELKRILRENGCYMTSEGASHEEWFSPITNEHFPVGRHGSKEVPVGTYNAIMRESGIRR